MNPGWGRPAGSISTSNALTQVTAEASHFAHYPTTHWSRVIVTGDLATPGANAALAELCHAYWYPIYAVIRRRDYRPE